MDRTVKIELSQRLRCKREQLAEEVLHTLFKRRPALQSHYSEEGLAKCKQDVIYHFLYLSEAIANNSQVMFNEYLAWVKVLFHSLNINLEHFTDVLVMMKEVLQAELSKEDFRIISSYIDKGLEIFPGLASTTSSFITQGNPYHLLARDYLNLLLKAKRYEADARIMKAVNEGVTVRDIYLNVFQPVQKEIGRLWQENQVSVAQEHYSTAATQLIMSRLYPYVFNTEKNGRVFIGACVGGELHEIGIRMITDFFEMEGWDTFFIGGNTPKESIKTLVTERGADILGLSCTISYQVQIVRELIAEMRQEKRLTVTKILVGGFPFNQDSQLWKSVGADAYAADAQQAIQIANELVS